MLVALLPGVNRDDVLKTLHEVKSDAINVKGQTVQLTWAFPAGQPFAGDAVAWTIHNGGSPAADTWKQVFLRSPLSETVEAGHIAIS